MRCTGGTPCAVTWWPPGPDSPTLGFFPEILMPRLAMTLSVLVWVLAGLTGGSAADAANAATHQRARDLGVPFDGTPGPLNAITDVEGVLVGHTTLISGSGKLVVGKGP